MPYLVSVCNASKYRTPTLKHLAKSPESIIHLNVTNIKSNKLNAILACAPQDTARAPAQGHCTKQTKFFSNLRPRTRRGRGVQDHLNEHNKQTTMWSDKRISRVSGRRHDSYPAAIINPMPRNKIISKWAGNDDPLDFPSGITHPIIILSVPILFDNDHGTRPTSQICPVVKRLLTDAHDQGQDSESELGRIVVKPEARQSREITQYFFKSQSVW